MIFYFSLSSSSTKNLTTLPSYPRFVRYDALNYSCQNFYHAVIGIIMSFLQIDTEQLLAHLVEAEMIKRTVSFHYCCFFLGFKFLDLFLLII
jgi:hypothetical protein